ncbi:LysE family translocator [Bacillus weihaiensis]|uniref:Amino acid transporter n=1 Tax=Bacillus weihaiensis TaxID=1547283 RepID=A0A1L3MX13_9BACI|nr:LysE family translocator [Bacillus weihaiensis]APH06862.1 amino acid transporter [Bacillus weihaiensis]
MNAFFSYMLLGISLSAPIGPINAAQLNKGIHNGFFHAWLVGLGAMFADVLFMLLIYFGVAQFLTTPFMKSFLWLFGFFILMYTGFESIKSAKNTLQPGITMNESRGKSFRTGFFMALSNPLNILFWLGIYGSVLAKTSDTYSDLQLIIYSGGIFIGILIWDVVMAGIASTFKKFMSTRALQFISVCAGLCLIGFGLYFGYEAYKFIFLK